jgi:hypothetical protein
MTRFKGSVYRTVERFTRRSKVSKGNIRRVLNLVGDFIGDAFGDDDVGFGTTATCESSGSVLASSDILHIEARAQEVSLLVDRDMPIQSQASI